VDLVVMWPFLSALILRSDTGRSVVGTLLPSLARPRDQTGSMGILDDDIQTVREASDIVAIISEHVALKRVGRRWQGLCPFHQEKSASFSVNQELGLYKCFGCGAGGDVITFVREIEHLDFPGSVEWLANKVGITLRYTDQHEGESRKRKAKLVDAMAKAVDWYHERLLSATDAGPARGYLRERGLDKDAVRFYKLGWAPEGWDTLVKALHLPDDVIVDAGLGFLNSRNRQTDAFRARVLFPIFDVNGDPVGFGGRIMPGVDGPKYKNSAESKLYAKSKLLYGLNWAKAAIVAADQVVVCEGYTDVIGLAAADLAYSVATCGTALTEDHVRVLKSFARRVVLAFDADAAGQNAADRVYTWEKTYEIDVAVASMPKGVDPADLARSDPDAMRAAIDEAVPFLQFRVNRVLDATAMGTAEGRARGAEAALAVIREHPSDLVRDQYVMEVASRTGLEPDRLRTRRAAPAARAPAVSDDRRSSSARAAREPISAGGPETEALGQLIEHRSDIESWLDDSLFDSADHLEGYRLLVRHPDARQAIDAADDRVADLLQRAAISPVEVDPFDTVVRLLQEAGARALLAIEGRARQADDPLAFAHQSAWLKLRLEELDEGARNVEAADQLLAWLSEQSGNDSNTSRGRDE
jgi:DNA primase